MSQELISRNQDLKRLRDEGYEVEIKATYLLLHSIPYVSSNKEIRRATLVSTLELAGDKTVKPNDHVAFFTGDHPCNKDGSEIAQIKHGSPNQTLATDLIAKHSFSNKPPGGYSDYHAKMTRYIQIISGPAESINNSEKATTFKPIESPAEDSVFNYIDTASSRAGIYAVTEKLKLPKVGIVGLGGTGSYVLDMVAKVPIGEIHLFDGDSFLQHNAFRSPGAASLDELNEVVKKVVYYRRIYSKMRKSIIAHESYINASNMEQLRNFSFVFICLDKNEIKKLLVEQLEEWNIPFIDVGMDVTFLDNDNSLIGTLRVTTNSRSKKDHFRNRVSLSDGEHNADYDRNIQIADLNALNAALAVVKWKKLFGFYQDLNGEHHSTYSLNDNMLRSEDLIA